MGGFLAAALTRSGEDTVLVARESTARIITRDGIALKSVRLGDFVARPAVASRLSEPVDVLLVATKATGLSDALERIETEPNLVIPLLNGLDHMSSLRARFGSGRVAAGTIRIEADRPQPGHVVQTSPFLLVSLASDDERLHGQLVELSSRLERAQIPTEIGASEAQILWSKLVRLNALACTTSAIDRPVGFIRSDPQWREKLIGCIFEASAVANADGAQIDPAARLAELDQAHPELGSSMQRDIAAGRQPELDAIPGAVLRAAARHGLECPTIAELVARIAERAGIPTPAP